MMTRSLPFHSKPKTLQRPEARLQKNLVSLLKLTLRDDVMMFATFNEYKGKRAMKDRKERGLLPGLSDMVFVIEGRAHFLELKAPGKDQNDNQVKFEASCDVLSLPYRVTDDINEAIEILGKWGALKARQKMARAA